MSRGWTGWLVLIGCALWLLTGCADRSAGSPSMQGDRVELTGWEYRWGDSPRDRRGRLTWLDPQLEPEQWSAMTLPGSPPGRPKGVQRVWLRTRIPDGPWREPVLMIDPIMTQYEAYLDGKRIDSFGAVDEAKDRWFAISWRTVRLPPDSTGKQLSLRIRSSFWIVGLRGGVALGSGASHLQAILRADIGKTITAAAAVFLGLLAWLVALFRNEERRLLASFGCYAVGVGVYTLFYTKLKDLLFDGPLFWYDIYDVGMHLCLIGLLVFTAEVFDNGPRQLLRRLWRFHFVSIVASKLFAYTLGYRSSVNLQLQDAQNLVNAGFRLLIAVEVVAIVYVVARHALSGDKEAQILTLGMLPGAVFTARDVLALFGVVGFNWDSWTFLGVLSMLLSLGVIVQRRREQRLQRLTEELATRAREKEAMLKDLHDGIGGITTNISLLTDVAIRDGSPERTQQVMQSIAELSREGIDEMRGLLSSLDERELTWERLVKQMRHIGSATFEPHGVAFRLDSDIAEGSSELRSFTYINVLRTYREALTNVIKHAQARAVTVELVVDAEAFRLRVTDDGVGFGADAGDSVADSSRGRGLGSMRGRASELGGELSVSSDDSGGSSIELNVPLPSR